ncbi:MAG: ABC transporter ATP-binding protein [bacterium]
MVISTITLSFIIALLPFAQSGLSALLINALIKSFGTGIFSEAVLFLASLTAVSYFVPDMVYTLKGFVDKRIYLNISEKFQLAYYKKKSEIDIQTFDNPAFNDMVNKAEDRGIWPIPNMIEAQFANIQNVVGVLTALTILVLFNWKICLIVIVAIIPQFISQIRYSTEVWSIWDADTGMRRRYSDLKDHFDRKSYLIELKIFQNTTFFFKKIAKILQDFNKEQYKAEKHKLFFELATTLLSGVIIGFVIFWVIRQVVVGIIAVGSMLFIISSIQRLQGALGGFIMSVGRQHELSLYVSNIFSIIETKQILPRNPNPIALGSSTPEIVFENVSFKYPQGSSYALKNISLTIKAGEKFALVGENGAGKTTFVKLLARIYDPTEGRILIDGQDLKDIDLDEWYKNLGILLQDYSPYHFEVKNVIALGRSDVPFDINWVTEAAKASQSESFILKWKEKYEQMLGSDFEGGIDPSKGQSQRLAVARLLHRKAGIMILDEPTASIDAEAEKKIFDEIQKSSTGQTVILISHKFSTVKNADRICVFKDTNVYEIGSHDQLIAQDGVYARLFNEQAKSYTE